VPLRAALTLGQLLLLLAHVLHMRHTSAMSKMLQVRNITERLHRELRRRAKARGQSLTDYVEEILEREIARPPAEEVFDRIESRRPVDLDIRVAEIIRQERSEREAS
jgi:plasmid stability protein